ncbi:hypothetical protein JTE90_003946 [Oedothorax gibbosus]|uniref:Uncharacterized protein n=1 Tax=Oedothorax gibbosus TaxID=931172 RepID=A0AAV6UYV5_9ARAC|nr:hypothetical protein JTE90_003946 [Oedothorax gibbosus]
MFPIRAKREVFQRAYLTPVREMKFLYSNATARSPSKSQPGHLATSPTHPVNMMIGHHAPMQMVLARGFHIQELSVRKYGLANEWSVA